MKGRTLSWGGLVAIIVTVQAAIALSVVPLGVGSETVWWPKLTYAVVFFWILHRPRGMPILVVLAIGVAQDLVGGGVPGAGALPLVIAAAVLHRWSEPLSLSPFVFRWLTFAVFAAFVFAGEFALTGLAKLAIPPFGAPLAQFFVTVLAYLPMSVIFRRVLRIGRT